MHKGTGALTYTHTEFLYSFEYTVPTDRVDLTTKRTFCHQTPIPKGSLRSAFTFTPEITQVEERCSKSCIYFLPLFNQEANLHLISPLWLLPTWPLCSFITVSSIENILLLICILHLTETYSFRSCCSLARSHEGKHRLLILSNSAVTSQ